MSLLKVFYSTDRMMEGMGYCSKVVSGNCHGVKFQFL